MTYGREAVQPDWRVIVESTSANCSRRLGRLTDGKVLAYPVDVQEKAVRLADFNYRLCGSESAINAIDSVLSAFERPYQDALADETVWEAHMCDAA